MARPVSTLCVSFSFALCLFPAFSHSSDSPPADSKRFLPELPSARFLPSPLGDATERQIIETAYATLASHIRSSGSLAFEVELTDFQTLYTGIGAR